MRRSGDKLRNGAAVKGMLFLPLFSLLLFSCVSGAMEVSPSYTTKSVSSVSGEIALGDVTYPDPRYGDLYSMGALRLTERIDYFCSNAVSAELQQYGLNLVPEAPLRLDAEVLRAETVWKQQGRAGVFTTNFAVRFIVSDQNTGEELYRKIHEASASHSQSYGGYPASASVVDALSTVYDRLLKDRGFQDTLVKSGSINLYGQEAAGRRKEEGKDYRSTIYRDYQNAIKDLSPDLLSYLEALRFDAVFAIFGFKNREGRRNVLSQEIEREIGGYLSRNRFSVVTRELDTLFEEQKLQYTGLFDENKRVEIGKLAGASHLITGSLYHYPDDGIITLRIEVVEVESGLVGASFTTNLLATGSYTGMVTAEP